MLRILIAFIFIIFSNALFAQEEIAIKLEKAPVNIHDTASIKRGATFFAKTCMMCHTLIYLRYDRLSKEVGVTYERMPVNANIQYQGIRPPDLSLEVSYRGADWVYTYLHSFYQDSSKQSGVNNLVFPNTAMPNILIPLQGQQIRIQPVKERIMDELPSWYDVLELQQQGSMSPQDYDQAVIDVVNYLAYASAPYTVQQHRLGYWVIGFLIIFFLFAYALKRDYWRDLK